MQQKWNRPLNIPFPNVWHRFEGKKDSNGIIPKFWIQDIPEESFENVITTMCEVFLRDELISKVSNAITNEQFVEENKQLWRKCLGDKVSLICYMENNYGNPIIAGINICSVAQKGDEEYQWKSPFARKTKGPVEFVFNMKDPFEYLKVDEFLKTRGLAVLSEFRGQGVGKELLKTREILCRSVGLKATVTAFTSKLSQSLAEECNFKVMSEIDYCELEKLKPEMNFPGISHNTKSIKCMYLNYQ